MKTLAAAILFLASVLPVPAPAAGVPQTEADRINYSVGYQIGGDFRKQGIEISPEMVVQGIRDALDGSAPKMAEQEMRKTLVALKAAITAAERKRKGGGVPSEPGTEKAFLSAFGQREGVVVLPSGLMYQVLREGTGRTPAAADNVTVNYRGSLAGGGDFHDSTKGGKPVELAVGKLVPGLQEALTRMKEGAHWQVVIPPSIGYREGSPLEGKTVVFDLELVRVVPAR